MSLSPVLALSRSSEGAVVGVVAVICGITLVVKLIGIAGAFRHFGKVSLLVALALFILLAGTLTGGIAIIAAGALLLFGCAIVSFIKLIKSCFSCKGRFGLIKNNHNHRNSDRLNPMLENSECWPDFEATLARQNLAYVEKCTSLAEARAEQRLKIDPDLISYSPNAQRAYIKESVRIARIEAEERIKVLTRINKPQN